MPKPKINTAIPKRRYQYGEFQIVILGDVDTSEPVSYRYIMAAVQEGQQDPIIYLASIRNRRDEAEGGSHRLVLYTTENMQILDHSDEWKDLETFSRYGLEAMKQALGLTDEIPIQIN
ncbi:MAG: hypothetical protein EP297_08405 [Gammaproteobacteria bacterium]|nr:MAG: hypothetical protein EP297_08405 [Gammaproteobacteria bacterium]